MALSKAYIDNFNTMLRAAKAGHLAIMECTDIASGEMRAVICAAQEDRDGQVHMVPFGHLCPGNPYEAYLPPVVDLTGDEPTSVEPVAPRRVMKN